MAVTRTMLKGMSLTEEQIDTIIDAHVETVNALKTDKEKLKEETDSLKEEIGKLKTERDNFKESAEKLPDVEKELETLKSKSVDDETKYNDLKKQFDDYKSEQSVAAEKTAKETAYKEMLKEAGVSEKRIASVMRVTNLTDIQLDKEGKLKDKEKLVENVKAEWADFIDTKDIKGAETKTPPENNGGKLTKEDILKIKDTTERQQKIAENHELFGF